MDLRRYIAFFILAIAFALLPLALLLHGGLEPCQQTDSTQAPSVSSWLSDNPFSHQNLCRIRLRLSNLSNEHRTVTNAVRTLSNGSPPPIPNPPTLSPPSSALQPPPSGKSASAPPPASTAATEQSSKTKAADVAEVAVRSPPPPRPPPVKVEKPQPSPPKMHAKLGSITELLDMISKPERDSSALPAFELDDVDPATTEEDIQRLQAMPHIDECYFCSVCVPNSALHLSKQKHKQRQHRHGRRRRLRLRMQHAHAVANEGSTSGAGRRLQQPATSPDEWLDDSSTGSGSHGRSEHGGWSEEEDSSMSGDIPVGVGSSYGADAWGEEGGVIDVNDGGKGSAIAAAWDKLVGGLEHLLGDSLGSSGRADRDGGNDGSDSSRYSGSGSVTSKSHDSHSRQSSGHLGWRSSGGSSSGKSRERHAHDQQQQQQQKGSKPEAYPMLPASHQLDPVAAAAVRASQAVRAQGRAARRLHDEARDEVETDGYFHLHNTTFDLHTIAPGDSIFKTKAHLPNCTVCRGCDHTLEMMASGSFLKGSYYAHEPGGSPSWLFRARTNRTASGWAVVKTWCVPVLKVKQRGLAMCSPKKVFAQVKLLLAQQKLTEECGFQSIVPKLWVEPVNGVIPGKGFHINWLGLWADIAQGVSVQNIQEFGKPHTDQVDMLDLFANRVNHTAIKMGAIFDLMFSQCDRHQQNIFLQEDGNVQFIDNDQVYSTAWRKCGIDSMIVPTTQKFMINHLGFFYVLKYPTEEPPKTWNKVINPLLLLDYRCHVEGGLIGRSFPPALTQCMKRLSSMSKEDIESEYGYPALRMADAVRNRSRDLLEHGYEWTLLQGEPTNQPMHRYKIPPKCCSMTWDETTRKYSCNITTEWQPLLEIPYGNAWHGGKWHGPAEKDTGTYVGGSAFGEWNASR